jgi:hypothetical protein
MSWRDALPLFNFQNRTNDSGSVKNDGNVPKKLSYKEKTHDDHMVDKKRLLVAYLQHLMLLHL